MVPKHVDKVSGDHRAKLSKAVFDCDRPTCASVIFFEPEMAETTRMSVLAVTLPETEAPAAAATAAAWARVWPGRVPEKLQTIIPQKKSIKTKKAEMPLHGELSPSDEGCGIRKAERTRPSCRSTTWCRWIDGSVLVGLLKKRKARKSVELRDSVRPEVPL